MFEKEDPACKFFGGCEAENLYQNEKLLDKMTQYKNMMQKFNVVLDLVVADKKGHFLLDNTQLTYKF